MNPVRVLAYLFYLLKGSLNYKSESKSGLKNMQYFNETKRMSEFGYTIIEAMIFLAISGLLFAAAVSAVSGNQKNVQYTQAVRDFEIQIKDVINDVANGYYPEYNGVQCGESAGQVSFTAVATSNPGTNEDCINIGKSLFFNLDGDDENFGVGTIVGVSPNLGESPDLALTALAPKLAYNANPALDLTISKPIRYGARVTKIASVNNEGQTYSSLSFISSLSSSLDSDFENGTLSTNVYGIRGSISDKNIASYALDVASLGNSSTQVDKNVPGGYYICLLTTDDRRARIFVGVDGVVTATKTEFDLDAGPRCP